uniref:Uncharacterized protein n=1 Tax=Fibrocapsa japonica TaxID=94617 RepID=A0A7S2XZ97_9STRA
MDESEAKGEVEASSEDEKGRNALQKLFFAAANKFLEQEEEKAAAQEVQGGDEQAVEIHQFLQGGLGDEQQEEGGGGGGEEQEDQVTVWEEEEEAYVVGVDSDVVGGTGYGLGEGSVALSYRSDNGTRDAEFYFSGEMKDKINPYVDVITRLSPGELIGRFVRSAPPRVQDAVTQTVAGLLGSMGPPAFQTSTVTTSMALANMMFQLQMTGYMFRNAEYRLSLAQSIRGSAGLLPGEAIEEAGKNVPALPQIQGTIKLITENGQEIEVDANAYMGELRQEVETLRAELAKIEEAKELETEENLLNYVKNMPEEQMQQLTSNMSPEVLDAMSQLVEIVSNTMGTSMVGANTLTHQTGSAMAQLCLWQLVIGYNLREVEAREELQKKFEASK